MRDVRGAGGLTVALCVWPLVDSGTVGPMSTDVGDEPPHVGGASRQRSVGQQMHHSDRSICFGVSAISALTLYLFDGFGEGVGLAVPRGVTWIDATVVLAIANCAALVSHAMVFRRECAAEVALGVTPRIAR